MSVFSLAALVCDGLAAALSLAFGLVYLTRSEFMPYHRDAIGADWRTLDPRVRIVFLALLRVAGGGFLAAGVSLLLLLLFPYRAGEPWARYALLAVGLASALPSLFATVAVRRGTPARPPVAAAASATALLAGGFALSLL